LVPNDEAGSTAELLETTQHDIRVHCDRLFLGATLKFLRSSMPIFLYLCQAISLNEASVLFYGLPLVQTDCSGDAIGTFTCFLPADRPISIPAILVSHLCSVVDASLFLIFLSL